MEFNLKGTMPIWQQLADQLKEAIVTGAYPPSSRFPSVRDLAASAGVNPNTMQRALAQLESEGLLTTNRTAGRAVTEDKDSLDIARRQLAEEKISEYLRGMNTLGYSKEEAAAMVAERGDSK